MAKLNVTVRLEPEVYDRVQVLAKDRDWSVSHWISRAVERVAEAEEDKRRPGGGRR